MVPEERIPRDLAKLIYEVGQDGGIFLHDTFEYHVIEIQTTDARYIIAPIDRLAGRVAIVSDGKYLRDPEIATITGSTWGGSTIRVRWLGIGMHLEIVGAPSFNKGTLTTGCVMSIKMLGARNFERIAQELISSARGNVADES